MAAPRTGQHFMGTVGSQAARREAFGGFSTGSRMVRGRLRASEHRQHRKLICQTQKASKKNKNQRKAKTSQGKKSQTVRQATTTYMPNTIPPEVKEILYPYRNSVVII